MRYLIWLELNLLSWFGSDRVLRKSYSLSSNEVSLKLNISFGRFCSKDNLSLYVGGQSIIIYNT